MKKYFLIVLAGYIIVAGGLALFVKEKPSEISVLSKEMVYSRIMTDPSETIDIPIYFSYKDSFMTEMTNIDKVMLSSKRDEVALTPVNIDERESEIYAGKEYTFYIFSFQVDNPVVDDVKLTFPGATLEIIYKNEVEMDLSIGDVNLLFDGIENNSHMEMSRMYATTGIEAGVEYVSGVVISFDVHTEQAVDITDIEVNCENARLDIDNAILVTEPPEMDSDVGTILGYEYASIVTEFDEQVPFTLKDQAMYFIPVQYKTLKSINRFPMIITYRTNGQQYEYKIDDFLFYSTDFGLETANENIREYNYQYR